MLLAEHPYALMIYHRNYGPEIAETIARETFQHPAMMVASDGIYHGTFSHPRSNGCFARAIRMGVRDMGGGLAGRSDLEDGGFPGDAIPGARSRVHPRGIRCRSRDVRR